jgi:cytochrome c oxidase cbb3-type subunit 2
MPLFTIIRPSSAPDMRVYTPLEIAAAISIREGCYACHSQMIRTLRDEVGWWPLFAPVDQIRSSMLWGSKRTGPDLRAWATNIRMNGT